MTMTLDEDALREDENEKLPLKTANELRRIAGELEAAGRMICDAPGSAAAHGHIDLALARVRDAIRSCYMMVGTGIKR